MVLSISSQAKKQQRLYIQLLKYARVRDYFVGTPLETFLSGTFTTISTATMTTGMVTATVIATDIAMDIAMQCSITPV